MAPSRPKCVAMTVKLALRYLMASSALANWAWAGRVNITVIDAAISLSVVFIFISYQR